MIRTRFAPSPTGYLHIGGLRTAIYAYALAKHDQGQFCLRIEDTDQKREVEGATEKIYAILKKFGIVWDELQIQSQRAETGIYKKAADQLLAEGHAFYCDCQGKNPKEDGYSQDLRDPCRDKGLTSGAVKLKVPDNQKVWFHDFVLKQDVKWESNDVSDATLLKSDGLPTYHLAMPVDDHEMNITHVIRTSEWLPSTPIHVLVFDFLGYKLPEIGHPTAILDPEGGKLSKRKGNVSVEQFLEEGYLPEALLNFVILLGWAPKDNRELFSLEELIATFDINGFQKSNPMMNVTKLDWFNGYYIRQKTDKELLSLVSPFSKYAQDKNFPKLVTLVKDRLVKLSDIDGLIRFIFETPVIDVSLIANPEASVEHLNLAKTIFAKENITQSVVDDILIPEVKNKGWKIGDFFMTLRVIICGTKFTPPLTDVMLVLGKDETLKRITAGIAMLK